MILDQIVSTVANNVAAGLAGQAKFDYPMEQLENDVWLERLSILNEWLLKGRQAADAWAQQVEVCQLKREDNSRLTRYCGGAVFSFLLPVPATAFQEGAIVSIGTDEHARSFAVYMDEGFKHHRQRRAAGRNPFVWINMATRTRTGEREFVEAFLFQPGCVVSRIVSRQVCEHAGQISALIAPDMPFPAPGEAIQLLIARLTERYLRYYQRGHSFYNRPTMNMPGVRGGSLPYGEDYETDNINA